LAGSGGGCFFWAKYPITRVPVGVGGVLLLQRLLLLQQQQPLLRSTRRGSRGMDRFKASSLLYRMRHMWHVIIHICVSFEPTFC